MLPGNDNSPGDDETWNQPSTPPEHEIDLDAAAVDPTVQPGLSAQSGWFTPPSGEALEQPAAQPRSGRRLPLRGWAALAALAAVTVGMLATTHSSHESGSRAIGVSVTAGPPATTTTAAASDDPCAGLSGAVVTNRAGKADTIAGVIATFEFDYYVERSAEKAMQLVAPDAGMTQQGLAEGIASIPLGATHCVSITPVTTNTANAHITELHPDGRRVDYLQVINTISAPGSSGALLISHVQEQG
ncbi:hypothetical protein NOVA_28940 [Nocardia nova]|uniref:hypothetical protein n=1 Tax=Nocardia nova TaxID=37330 RepID=UPI001C43FCB1|nr:hypothetical protein [Nocardia nova]MBV7706819.1 hypothetical protein [Nocardia nova]